GELRPHERTARLSHRELLPAGRLRTRRRYRQVHACPAQSHLKERSMKTEVIRETVAVIGAGPVGLAAAAHLLERGLIPLIFEAGPSIASNFEAVRHV